MAKHKISIFIITFLLIISLFLPIVNAVEETTDPTATSEDTTTVSEDATTDDTTTSEDTTIATESVEQPTLKQDDLYIFQDDVTIDYQVDGNLFIFANNVTITSQIGGDAFIFANSINIEEDAYILNNLFVCCNDITVKGIAYNIYSISNTLTIDGFILRDLRCSSNSVHINGMVGRNAYMYSPNIIFQESTESASGDGTITSYGSVQGNLTYYSENEQTFPDTAVSGTTNYTSVSTSNNTVTDYIYSLGTILVLVIFIWLISLWLSPRFAHNSNTDISAKKILRIIGLGILVPIIIALLAIITLFIPITSSIAVLFIYLLFILLFVSSSITIININDIICNKLNISQNICKLGFLILSTLIFWLLTLIPYVGVIVYVIAIILGIGSVSYKVFIKEETSKTSDDITDKSAEQKSVKNKTENKTVTKSKENTDTKKSNKSKEKDDNNK